MGSTTYLNQGAFFKYNWQEVRKKIFIVFFQELRQMDDVKSSQVSVKQATFRDKNSGEIAQLKSELILYKRRYQRSLDKEKRIQVEEPSFVSMTYW